MNSYDSINFLEVLMFAPKEKSEKMAIEMMKERAKTKHSALKKVRSEWFPRKGNSYFKSDLNMDPFPNNFAYLDPPKLFPDLPYDCYDGQIIFDNDYNDSNYVVHIQEAMKNIKDFDGQKIVTVSFGNKFDQPIKGIPEGIIELNLYENYYNLFLEIPNSLETIQFKPFFGQLPIYLNYQLTTIPLKYNRKKRVDEDTNTYINQFRFYREDIHYGCMRYVKFV